MPDFTAARINMVDSQIHTMGVVNDTILEAFRTIRREEFVPDERRAIAYCDEDLPLGQGRCLMEPVTHARLLQAAAPVATDTVLDIGCASGYSSAIIASMTSRVVAVEQDPTLLAAAEQNWMKLGITNVQPHLGAFQDGMGADAPYSLILINGGVAAIPTAILDQLAPMGRLLAVTKSAHDKIGRAVILTKTGTGAVSERVLFDAAVPYLPGLSPRNDFVF